VTRFATNCWTLFYNPKKTVMSTNTWSTKKEGLVMGSRQGGAREPVAAPALHQPDDRTHLHPALPDSHVPDVPGYTRGA
jgi:hypothetical protein